MSIEPPQSEYRQVARILREEIKSGVYAPGSVLPAEPELAARLGVTRGVVNKALGVLRSEGLVRPKRGRGTTVNPIPGLLRRNGVNRQRRQVREAGNARGAFDAEVRALGLTPRSEVRPEQTTAPAHIAEILGIEEGADVLARHRVMYANDVPVQVATSWIPWEIAEGTPLTEVDTGAGGTYSRLADLGHPIAVFRERVQGRMPEDAEARSLDMDPDQRVLGIIRTAQTAEGRIVEVNEIALPIHQWELEYEWDAE